jgi:hypothetical protein
MMKPRDTLLVNKPLEDIKALRARLQRSPDDSRPDMPLHVAFDRLESLHSDRTKVR